MERKVDKLIEEYSNEEEKDKRRHYQVIEVLIKCYVLAKFNTCQPSHSQRAGMVFMDLPFAGHFIRLSWQLHAWPAEETIGTMQLLTGN